MVLSNDLAVLGGRQVMAERIIPTSTRLDRYRPGLRSYPIDEGLVLDAGLSGEGIVRVDELRAVARLRTTLRGRRHEPSPYLDTVVGRMSS